MLLLPLLLSLLLPLLLVLLPLLLPGVVLTVRTPRLLVGPVGHL